MFVTTPTNEICGAYSMKASRLSFAPNPHHVIPVVWHGPVAFLGKTASLQFAPVMIGAPGDAQLEALFKCCRRGA
jgi:hypothetical protein